MVDNTWAEETKSNILIIRNLSAPQQRVNHNPHELDPKILSIEEVIYTQ